MNRYSLLKICLSWAIASIAALVSFAVWAELTRGILAQADRDLKLAVLIAGSSAAFTICGMVSSLIFPLRTALSGALPAGCLALVSLGYILGIHPLLLVLTPLFAGFGGLGGWLGRSARGFLLRKSPQ